MTPRHLKGWREHLAWFCWHAHPARPGPLYAFLKESQWWPRERLEDYQAGAVRRLIRIASAVPFYRQQFAAAGVGPDDIRTFADIRRAADSRARGRGEARHRRATCTGELGDAGVELRVDRQAGPFSLASGADALARRR